MDLSVTIRTASPGDARAIAELDLRSARDKGVPAFFSFLRVASRT